ncbi:hypothetical protein FHS26_003679 [Rhizobium pisi]|uniref:Uncharacterized protein n=1 Tax=Rhizobium pisi TaxID=574561 RepID=A0A7W5G0I4_9HYPH|nr:hypothetical protein [Rhizobium pisi]
MSIRVTTTGGEALRLSRALKRELLKILPFIAFVGIDSIVAVTVAHQGLDAMLHAARDGIAATTISVLAGVVILISALVWWLLPLIRWRGQMFYDRFAGTLGAMTRMAQSLELKDICKAVAKSFFMVDQLAMAPCNPFRS